jgi:hypothetical protein
VDIDNPEQAYVYVQGVMSMVLLITMPIALIEITLLFHLLERRGNLKGHPADRNKTLNATLMRFAFSAQLITELLTGSKMAGCIFSFILGIGAGYLAVDAANLSDLSDILMNVFMGISMGIFLIGHLSLSLTLLLIAPVLLSSGLAYLHMWPVRRKR